MNYFWQYKKEVINLASASEGASLQASAADELEILLDSQTLQIEQFSLKIEKNITEAEQIIWHINSLLSQPIENYFYAYQVYLRDEENLQGLFCVVPRADLAPLLALPKVLKIHSADKQFLLCEKKPPFWQIETYLARLYKYAKILCLCAAIGGLLVLPFLFWAQNVLSARHTALTLETQNLSAQINLRKNYERRSAGLQKNKLLNKKIGDYFYTFSLGIPEQVYFTELNYNAQELRIDGFCPADKELKALQKALKTETAIKPELAKLSKGEVVSFSLRVDLQKFLEKELKIASTNK